jgi:hypothetical protein
VKNERTLRVAEDAGPFVASVSFKFNKESGEWDIPHSVFIEGRGRSGTELDNWLNELGVKLSKILQGKR